MIEGVGLGLRSCHYQSIIAEQPAIAWFEVLADNYFVDGGPALSALDVVCQKYPVVLHGVGLSLGSADPLDKAYLKQLTNLAERTSAAWVSEHLSWGARAGQHLHDLLPLPYTQEVIDHLVPKIKAVQAILQRPFLVENIAAYGEFHVNTMPEWAFVSEITEQADCGLLLDVNNLYVNARNFGFDALQYLEALPVNRVKQIHLAGYEDRDSYLYDNHGDHVQPGVWSLYEKALQRFGAVPTLIEWDMHIPPLAVMMAEAQKAKKRMESLCEGGLCL